MLLNPTPPLRLRVIDTRQAFAQLKDDWNTLILASSAPSPFMTWEWLDTWLEEYCRTDQKLMILTAWQGTKLMAGLPLLFSQRRWCGFFVLRQIEFVGTGEPEWEEVCGEYSDLIAEPKQVTEAVALFATYLQALAWDRFELRNVLDTPVFIRQLLPLLPQATVQEKFCGQRHRVSLPAEITVYRDSLNRRMRRRIKRIDKFKQLPEIKIEIVNDAEALPGVLGELRKLHQARWRMAGKPGAFRSARFSRFHDKITASFLREGWLQLQRITDRGEAILVNYNIRFGDTEYYYQSGFNLDKYRNQSLGVLAHMNAIESAIESGLGHYDFMQATGDSYKLQYQCETTTMNDFILIKSTFVGQLLVLHSRFIALTKKLWRPE